MTGANVSNDSIEHLCNHCGKTFSTFLHEMADQNAKVVCPNCRENSDCKPKKGVQPGSEARPATKPN
jgi:DNA-directed RNA polymerase subunit RPC12/RpoP